MEGGSCLFRRMEREKGRGACGEGQKAGPSFLRQEEERGVSQQRPEMGHRTSGGRRGGARGKALSPWSLCLLESFSRTCQCHVGWGISVWALVITLSPVPR